MPDDAPVDTSSVDTSSVDTSSIDTPIDPAIGAVDGSAEREPAITVDRVGPGGTVASDSAFGVALVSLWQKLAENGAPVGFPPPVSRIDVAGRAAALVEDLRKGRVVGVAANRSRRLIGVGLLRPGRGSREHTGRIELLLVDADRSRAGLGTRLMDGLLTMAAARGLERVDLEMQDDPGLAEFFGRFGFVEWGRRPGWLRLGADGERDEVLLGAVLGSASR